MIDLRDANLIILTCELAIDIELNEGVLYPLVFDSIFDYKNEDAKLASTLVDCEEYVLSEPSDFSWLKNEDRDVLYKALLEISKCLKGKLIEMGIYDQRPYAFKGKLTKHTGILFADNRHIKSH